MANNQMEIIELSSDTDENYADMLIRDYTTSSSDDENEQENGNNVEGINIMPILDSFDGSKFKTRFKFHRSTVENLVALYTHSLNWPTTIYNPRLQMYIFLWYITRVISFQNLAIFFGVPRRICINAVRYVSTFLVAKKQLFVKWPEGIKLSINAKKIERTRKIPGVIGVIGCSHFKMSSRITKNPCYLNRKRNYTLILQAVVDVNNKFIDIWCGEPGSLNDSAVLQRSSLFTKASENCNHAFPNNTFILGHSGYSAQSWLVPPFRNTEQGLTDQKKKFNRMHKTTHMIAKKTFTQLKARFRRITKLTGPYDVKTLSNIIESACVLHNYCLGEKDYYLQKIKKNSVPEASERREILFNSLLERGII